MAKNRTFRVFVAFDDERNPFMWSCGVSRSETHLCLRDTLGAFYPPPPIVRATLILDAPKPRKRPTRKPR